MTNEELLAKIKEEFERRMKILREDEVVRQNCTSDFLEGKIYGYEELLSFLSTLESEHLADARKTSPKDLEEAAIHSEILTYPMPEDGDIEKVFKVQEARVFHEIGFIAGAKWQKEQFEKKRLAACDNMSKEEYDRETDFVDSIIEKEHRQPTFSDAINYGMRLQKEQMMKKAVERTIDDCGTPARLRLEMPGGSFRIGDKVRVIVLPKEDEK